MSSISNAAAIASCNSIVDLVDVGSGTATGIINIYSGSVPANTDAALGGATLLAELVMTNPAFGNAADAGPNATATAASITNDSSANATGTASFFRVVDRDGTAIIQGTVGTGSEDMVLNSAAISSGAAVAVTSFTYTCNE